MGRLKPLIKIDGLTFLQRIVKALKAGGIENITIVTGFEAERLKSESGVDAHFVVNENFKDGKFSSLQCGIQSLSEKCTGVVVCLGDQPQIKSAWIQKMIKKFESTNAVIVRPSFCGRSGHPIIYSANVFIDILNLPPTASAKKLMAKYSDETIFVDLESDAILYDADRPEDLKTIERLIKSS